MAVAAMCGSGYQSSFTGTTGQLSAASADRISSSASSPTGWVGRELLALRVPKEQTFLAPADPLKGFTSAAAEGSNDDGALQLSSVPLDGPARPSPGTLMSPLALLSPSSPFGERINPITGEAGEFHYGLDFAAPCGTAVHAADAGTVRAVGWHPWGGGNRVEIDHGNGLITTYNHLEGISVEAGDKVAVSQVVAAIGSTGSSTGCHLHFETIRDGSHVDPAGWTLTPLGQATSIQSPAMISYEPGGSGPGDSVPWVIAMPHEVSPGYPGGNDSSGYGLGLIVGSAPVSSAPQASFAPLASGTVSQRATVKRVTSAAPSPASPGPSASPAPSATPKQASKPAPVADAVPTPKPAPSTRPDSPTPSPTPSDSAKPKPSPSPEPTPTPSPDPKPKPSPSPEPTPTPSPDPTPSPSPDPAPEPSPDPEAGCDVEPEPAPDPRDDASGDESDKVPAPGLDPEPIKVPEPEVAEAPENGAADEPVADDKASDDGDPANPEPGCEEEDPSPTPESGAESEEQAAARASGSTDPGSESDLGSAPDADPAKP